MNQQTQLIQSDVIQYLEQHENKGLLRFITCGSVDDGKSTLIGRLLHDSKMIYEDQLAAITKDSKKSGTVDGQVDLALLVDGLQSEREQGITIDVAYRYFSTERRKFIIADTPGHEQYTRNMVTGASTADLAIILIDARYGVQVQTKRHSYLVSLLGIKNVAIAINKMDLLDYDEATFKSIVGDYQAFSQKLNFDHITYFPLSALAGDNVVDASSNTPWYQGSTLLDYLETVDVEQAQAADFRFPVQYVVRPNLDYRGFSGTVTSGSIKVGDTIKVLPSNKSSKVKSIDTFDDSLQEAFVKQAVTLTLEDEIDISRGDMIVKADDSAVVATEARAMVVWMGEESMQPNKQYDFKLAAKYTSGAIINIEHKVDVNTLEELQGRRLELNEIAECQVKFTQKCVLDEYQSNRQTGSFIIIDRMTNVTVGAGMIVEPLSNEQDTGSETDWQAFEIEFNALVRKHFPHWDAKDISSILSKK